MVKLRSDGADALTAEPVELVAVGVAEGDGHGQCIGGVVRFGDSGQMQQDAGHLLHLLLDRFAVARDGLFHLHGRVLVDGDARLCRRQQDDTARFRHADDRRLVVLVEQLLDGKHLRPGPLDDLFHAGVHLVEPPLERDPCIGADRSEIHRREPVPRIVQNAPSYDGIPRVDAQNSHSAIPFLL